MSSTAPSQSAEPTAEASRRSRWPKIIGFVCAGYVFLILAAILIPCFVDTKLAADESTAVGSLRAIATAQRRFSEGHREKGFAVSLSELGTSGANEIDAVLASGTKSGYVFAIAPAIPDASGHTTKYIVTASPEAFGKSGTRSFFIDESGLIRSTSEDRRATASDPALQ